MKVRVYKRDARGIRPGSSHLCIKDAKSGDERWFDYGSANCQDEFIALPERQWSPADRMISFSLPEEADNGAYSAWVSYDDIVEKPDWLLNTMVAEVGREAALWIRENWRSAHMGTMPPELAELVRVAALTS